MDKAKAKAISSALIEQGFTVAVTKMMQEYTVEVTGNVEVNPSVIATFAANNNVTALVSKVTFK